MNFQLLYVRKTTAPQVRHMDVLTMPDFIDIYTYAVRIAGVICSVYGGYNKRESQMP